MMETTENLEANSAGTVIGVSDCSSTTPQLSSGQSATSSDGQENTPPKGYEGVPKELWPDKDGNPPAITERLLRFLRGKYFTVRHIPLNECGHMLDMINEPRHRNCENCWFQFFNTHPQLVEVADQFFRTHGRKPMEGMRGKKWVVMFLRYMATVIHLMKQEGRIPSESDSQQGSNAGSIDGQANAQGQHDEAGGRGDGAASGSDDQRGEVESGRISSGLIQH